MNPKLNDQVVKRSWMVVISWQSCTRNNTCVPFSVRLRNYRYLCWASLEAQTVKNLPAMQEMQIQSLSREDPLEEEKGTHSSILAWRIP